MASFKAKIGWKWPRKSENKNSSSAPFLPNAKQKISKKQQKNLKIKKYHYGFITSQKQVGKGGERDKIKIIVTFRFYPTRNLKFKKNINKFKKLKYTIIATFQDKIGWKRPRKRESKNYQSVPFLHYA